MVVFNTDYYHTMDREYDSGFSDEPDKNIAGTISVGEIGTSVTETQGVTGQVGQRGQLPEAFQFAIRQGAKNVELAINPEDAMRGTGAGMYGPEERKDIRDLAKINDVHITSIHSPTQVGNLTGRTERGYNEDARFKQINEIRKAIHLAADVNEGKGATGVVVHTGEFERPIRGAEGNLFRSKMPATTEEDKTLVSPNYRIIDRRTGEVAATIKRDDKHYVFPDEGEKPQAKDWNYFLEEAKKQNKRPEDVWLDKTYIDERKRSMQVQLEHTESYYKDLIENHKERAERIKRKIDNYKSKVGQIIKHPDPYTGEMMEEQITPEYIKELEEKHANQQKEIKDYYAHISDTKRKLNLEMKKLEDTQRNFVSEEEYAKERAFDSYAELGIEAMRTSNTRKLQEGKGVYVAPENIFPEMGYGSHPDELIELVQRSRKKMANKLISLGYDPNKAQKEAKEHIKATMDTEHLGMWYQYFKRENIEMTEEQRRKEFNKWFMKKIDKLQKSDIIGHVHIADSFGYGHTNQVAGTGMLPLREAISYLKKKGYKGTMMSEGYGSGSERQLVDAWRHFGAGIRGKGTEPFRTLGGPNYFNQVRHFGASQMGTATYLFGDLAPSTKSGWTKEQLWSETTLE